ncbi:hypothetical protein V0288_10645 [Pannus brasiliensis CCIBt3594]|uniref:Phage abortive infection protein n=1 Tax=Pannus brasiliensis CCIBt3594 TaxID=1427578 RepID=A0AAW9QTG8_9CHRO
MKPSCFERSVLKELGIKKDFLHRLWFWSMIVSISIAIWIGLMGLALPNKTSNYQIPIFGNKLSLEKQDCFTIAGAVAALGTAIVASIQWLETKQDASLDKFYDRINLTNEQLSCCRKVCDMFPYFWDETGKKPRESIMYVYLELDNLEYAIAKYQHGSMEIEIAFRSLKTFLSRCQSQDFLDMATKYVKRSIGYSDITKVVVNKIADPSTISNSEVELWITEHLKSPSSNHSLVSLSETFYRIEM